jgi:hypothetical protein
MPLYNSIAVNLLPSSCMLQVGEPANFSTSVSTSLQSNDLTSVSTNIATSLPLSDQEANAVSSILLSHEASRPNTSKQTWNGYQRDFLAWCHKKNYANDIVTEGKLNLFLTEIKGRPTNKRGRKRKAAQSVDISTENTDSNTTQPNPIGSQSYKAYATAIMNLWKQQFANKRTSQLPIRPPCIRYLLQERQRDEVATANAAYVDRGAGTLAEFNKYEKGRGPMALSFWNEKNEDGLKLRSDFLLSYALTTRGANLRSLHLSEIGMILTDEGVEGAPLLRTVWRKSKANQFGRMEQNAALRHLDVTQCPIGALAFGFFWRWRIRGKPWPDFSSPSGWYDLFVYPSSKDPTKPTKYSKVYKGYKASQADLGIEISVKTQGGRKHAASSAENAGANPSNVEKAGHWSTSNSKEGAYTNNVIP